MYTEFFKVFLFSLRQITFWCLSILLCISKFVEYVTDARATTSSAKFSDKNSTQSKKPKRTAKKQTKSSELPVFNTKLTTPIESILEEAITEELSASETTSSVKDIGKQQLNSKTTNKSKNKSRNKKHQKPETDNLLVRSGSSEEKLTEEDSDSFLTVVKDKRNKNKPKGNNSSETSGSGQVKQIDTNTKSLVTSKESKTNYSLKEIKESKKVEPSLSYANAVSNNNFTKNLDDLNSFNEEENDIIENREFTHVTKPYDSNIEESTEQLTELAEAIVDKPIVELSNSTTNFNEVIHQEDFDIKSSRESFIRTETDEVCTDVEAEAIVNEPIFELSNSVTNFNEVIHQEDFDIKSASESFIRTENIIDQNYFETCDLKIAAEKLQQLLDNTEIDDGIDYNNQEIDENQHDIELNSQEIIVNQNGTFHEEESVIGLNNSLETSFDSYQRHKRDLSLEAMTQIRILSLNDREHQESTIYRVEKNWIIQFRLGPSLFGHKVFLYCNYPRQVNGRLEEFNRRKYQLLTWCQDEGCKNSDDTAAFAQIEAEMSGSFHYYFLYDDIESDDRKGSGYFIIDPILKYGKNEDLPLDCIQSQTVLAKRLGPFTTWESKLKVAKESGYNMIHFTPIQELGASNSSYSLSEQLNLNPVFADVNGKMPTLNDVEAFVGNLRKESKIASICDIVLNHTANESQWLKTHPEATYNCHNCPYMRPAYVLDAAFHCFSNDVNKGMYEDRGIPPEVTTEEHLNAIRYHFKLSVLEPLKLYEMFTVDVEKVTADFLILARQSAPSSGPAKGLKQLELLQDNQYRRLHSAIDMGLALKLYNVYRNDCFDEETRLKRCAEELKLTLEKLNSRVKDEVNADLHAALENVIAGIKYFRVQADGPKFREITVDKPLVYRYFTDFGTPKSIKEHEEIMYGQNGAYLMAHNGWVMNSDPLKNFADPSSKIYIRRELIAWGDSVKLRYGDSPSDCPFLWEHMRKYVELTAKIFDGVRLDNCHSTPLNVAEYLIDCARRVNPDLYVVAELFTNSDLTDNIFVNRLGITSLIREAMSAWDSHEEGRLVYRYGGVPVGSFYQPNIRPLVPSVAHALFLDLTHDNPSPIEKRSVFDLLPSSALVNMACCASGSNRGYDELVPHHIHVVDEGRQYAEWTDDADLAKGSSRYISKRSGIIAAKRAMNELHYKLGKGGFNQVYVDQMDHDVVAVTRHNALTHESYILVAHTAFSHPSKENAHSQKYIRPLKVEGVLDEVVYEASLVHVSQDSPFDKFDNFVQDPDWINGLTEYKVNLKEHISIHESDVFELVNSNASNEIQLNFRNFKPGSAVVIKVSLPAEMCEAVNKIRKLMREFSLTKNTELRQIVERMRLADLNRALYRCDQEERDEGYGFDVYNIPNFGSMVYAGFQGMISLLSNIRPNNDLGHPMCGNLRDGNWMIEFVWKRLKMDEGTKQLGQWFEENTKCFKSLPRYLVPCYFDVVVTGTYIQLIEQCYQLMSSFVANGSTFVKALSLGSVQFGAYIESADLPNLSPNLLPPKPPMRDLKQMCVTLSAGLPHFSVGYMRNWGRDTFIALRGLFIITGRYQETREHILGYAACLRHGLIPNLLDGGRNPRFNCRDAVWWWLYCIKEYIQNSPHGAAILKDKVSRIFPKDDSPPQSAGKFEQPLHDVIQEALSVHFQGLAFRERNAGKQIDEHMNERGFNNQIGVHPETGFVFGGNEWNCGTWMDKMGSSDRAGNRGKPATPRDGSAVEIIGLSKCVISWLHRMNQEKKYPYDGVGRTHKNGTITKWTFKEWSDKIQENFEKYFWIPSNPVLNDDLVNKRGIYKDCYGATQPWTDYQLRCNFPIAMVVAPELFSPQNAWLALNRAEKHLLGPLGMKTLDASDWNYRGDYDNSNDTDDHTIAHGFNYHQGPEWVWPVGFFLRAKLMFAAQNGALKETVAATKVILSKHFVELQTSPWRGLPELTNSNGTYCRDSSRTQAWSMSCILEVLHELQQIESMQISIN